MSEEQRPNERDWQAFREFKKGYAPRKTHHDDQTDARVEEEVAKIPPEWQADFRSFVTTGEASDGFLKWLDGNREALDATERIMRADGFMNDFWGKGGIMDEKADVPDFFPDPDTDPDM